jgi:hypothetical protein
MEICTQGELPSLSLTNNAPQEPIELENRVENQVEKHGLCFCACCERMRVPCSEFGPNLNSLPPKATFFAHLNRDSPHPWSLLREASTVMTPT